MNIQDIVDIADLARLSLEEEEARALAPQLQRILEHVAVLDELALDHIPARRHAAAARDVFRNDEPARGLDVQDATANAPETLDGQFSVPRAVK